MKKDKRDKFYAGVEIIVYRGKKLLLGKRKGGYMSGTWGLPGGHLEYGEKLTNCALRELYEETGIKGKNVVFAGIHNWFQKKDGRHYLFTVFKMESKKGEPKLMEPDKCSEWRWFDFGKLPKNICLPHKRDLEIFLKNKSFLD